MRISDLLSLSTRMFKTRPMRTFLTVLGVSVGIGTVLFLVSLGYGLQDLILSRIATADTLLTLDVSPGPSDILTLDEATIAKIEAMPNIEGVSRSKTYSAQMTVGDLTGNAQLTLIDHSFLRLKGIVAVAGSLPEAGSVDRGILLSSAAVRLFDSTPEEMIGRQVYVTVVVPTEGDEIETVEQKEPYDIKGIVEDENVSFGYVLRPNVSGLTIDEYDQLKVKVDANDALETVRTELLTQGFVVSALSDIIDQASKVFRIVQIVLALFGLVALGVSAIGMFNTMTIALLERTNEIGIMRAIGVTRRDLRHLFLAESMFMGFLGGLGGVLLGVCAGKIANIGINMLAQKFGGPVVDLFLVPVWFVTVIIIFSTIIGLLTGMYPSFRASRLNPLDALRYK